MSVSCPTCGDGFDGKKGMKYHHARVHGESIAGDKIECDYCGTVKRRNPAKINREGNVYCSSECQHKAKRVDIPKDELYEWYWGNLKTSYEIAEQIDEKASLVVDRLNDHGIPTVGASKTHSAWIFRMRGKEWLRREYKEGDKSTYQIAHENDVYFEWVRQMLHEWEIKPRRPGYVGRKETKWPSPKYDYGPNWPEQRQKALERDNYVCQECGTDGSEFYHGLEVHHCIPFPEFDDRKEANRVENLVPLCPDCHDIWETIPVRPKRI